MVLFLIILEKLGKNEIWVFILEKGMDMLTVNVPDKLSGKINEIARSVCQTPEEYVLELIAERVEHDSAYRETAYLAKSETNRKRLNKAVKDIRSGKYEARELIDGND